MSKEIEDILNFWYMMGGGLIVTAIAVSIHSYLDGKKLKREMKKEEEKRLYQRAHSHMDMCFENKCRDFEDGLLDDRKFKHELSFCLRYYFNLLNQENQEKARIYAIKLGDFS